MADDYEDLMNQTWDDIPDPVTLPVGTYRLRLERAMKINAKSQDQNDRCLFIYTVKEALDDVDPDALAELGENYDITMNKVFFDIWLDDASKWGQVRKHFKKHGVDLTGKTIVDTLKNSKGYEIFAYLDEDTYTDAMGEVQTKNVPKNFAPVDD